MLLAGLSLFGRPTPAYANHTQFFNNLLGFLGGIFGQAISIRLPYELGDIRWGAEGLQMNTSVFGYGLELGANTKGFQVAIPGYVEGWLTEDGNYNFGTNIPGFGPIGLGPGGMQANGALTIPYLNQDITLNYGTEKGFEFGGNFQLGTGNNCADMSYPYQFQGVASTNFSVRTCTNSKPFSSSPNSPIRFGNTEFSLPLYYGESGDIAGRQVVFTMKNESTDQGYSGNTWSPPAGLLYDPAAELVSTSVDPRGRLNRSTGGPIRWGSRASGSANRQARGGFNGGRPGPLPIELNFDPDFPETSLHTVDSATDQSYVFSAQLPFVPINQMRVDNLNSENGQATALASIKGLLGATIATVLMLDATLGTAMLATEQVISNQTRNQMIKQTTWALTALRDPVSRIAVEDRDQKVSACLSMLAAGDPDAGMPTENLLVPRRELFADSAEYQKKCGNRPDDYGVGIVSYCMCIGSIIPSINLGTINQDGSENGPPIGPPAPEIYYKSAMEIVFWGRREPQNETAVQGPQPPGANPLTSVLKQHFWRMKQFYGDVLWTMTAPAGNAEYGSTGIPMLTFSRPKLNTRQRLYNEAMGCLSPYADPDQCDSMDINTAETVPGVYLNVVRLMRIYPMPEGTGQGEQDLRRRYRNSEVAVSRAAVFNQKDIEYLLEMAGIADLDRTAKQSWMPDPTNPAYAFLNNFAIQAGLAIIEKQWIFDRNLLDKLMTQNMVLEKVPFWGTQVNKVLNRAGEEIRLARQDYEANSEAEIIVERMRVQQNTFKQAERSAAIAGLRSQGRNLAQRSSSTAFGATLGPAN